jgi:Toprim domain
MFLAAQPSLTDTPAAQYLAGRGIDLAALGRQPRCLRFAPSLANRESGRSWPAMLAAITDAAGVHVATHRTWLARSPAGIWGKAPLRDAKMTLGSYAGGSTRLWRGASGKPLAQAPAGETVVIGEGIETCLSVVVSCPELRVLCAVSLANMARLVLPEAVGEVILLADNDAPGSPAFTTLARVVKHFAGIGKMVRVARSPIGKDFNDALRAGVVA